MSQRITKSDLIGMVNRLSRTSKIDYQVYEANGFFHVENGHMEKTPVANGSKSECYYMVLTACKVLDDIQGQ